MIMQGILNHFNQFFFLYMFAYALVFFCITLFAALSLDDFFIRKEYMSSISLINDENHIPISILVPAHNEEMNICDSIQSLLNLDYPEYEIIVINDGSSDTTGRKVEVAYHLNRVTRPIQKSIPCKDEISVYVGGEEVPITLINKEKGGKADALNMGINTSRYPLYVCMDADSMLQKDALKRIVEPFLESDDTIAVGGNIKVSNSAIFHQGEVIELKMPKKVLVLFQIIEYLRVFLTSRITFNVINSNLIISGAFGLFKKQAAVNVGGYTPDIIGEDMEIVVKMHAFYRKNRLPYRISHAPDAICWTQVPETLRILRRQRRRWHIGMDQSLRSHWFMAFNPKYGAAGLFGYPYFLLFEYIAPLVEILGIILIVLSYFFKVMNIHFFIVYLLVHMGFNMIVSIIAVLLEKYMIGDRLSGHLTFRLLLFCVLETLGYRQLCSIFRLTALLSFKKREWGDMTRTKNLSMEDKTS